jgi:NAD(P)-dependent dehydrogenase (short-subunit alcohol dehydrogenase family)
MAGRFEGRTAVVAGGSSGFGFDAARALISDGAQVVIGARNEERLRAAADAIGAVGVVCDIAADDSVAGLAAAAVERFGRIDIAINSAGIEDQAPIRNLTPEKLEPMVAIQFTGAVYFIRHMAAAMSEGGSIITVSSLTASLVPENYAAYAGAKAGINHVTRIAAAEYGPDGIRVNTVAPSIIETPMTRHILAIPAVREAFLEQTPLGRFGEVCDVTNAMLWLASDEARYITGQNLVIDGGTSTRKLPSAADFMRHARRSES